MLVLSLFPGIGLLDMAFEQAGFCVVRGPDALWGGDIKTFHPPAGKFDGVIGGPPCQYFSSMRYIVAHNRRKNPGKYAEAENLIPEFVRCVIEARPTWWLMENVPTVLSSEWPRPDGYHITTLPLNNRWLPDTTPQNRLRRFWFGHRDRAVSLEAYLDIALFEPVEWEYAVTAAGTKTTGQRGALSVNGKPRRLPKSRTGSNYSIGDYLRLQGLPETFLEDAPFTVAGKKKVLGNGVSLPVGRAVAAAVARALETV